MIRACVSSNNFVCFAASKLFVARFVRITGDAEVNFPIANKQGVVVHSSTSTFNALITNWLLLARLSIVGERDYSSRIAGLDFGR